MLLAVYIVALLVFFGYKKWQQQLWRDQSPIGVEQEDTVEDDEDPPVLRHRVRDDWQLVPLEMV